MVDDCSHKYGERVDAFHGGRAAAGDTSMILAGRDVLQGESGDDFLIGDSTSLFTENVVDANGVAALSEVNSIWVGSIDAKLETKYLQRSGFELLNYYKNSSRANLYRYGVL